MKKLTVLLLITFFAFQVADAQIFRYGIKAGAGFSSLKFEDITGITSGPDAYDLITGESVMGYHLGVQTRINIAMLVIQPEVYFNAGGGTVERVVEAGANELLDVTFSRIDIPILVGVKLGPARLNVGPAGSYILNQEHELGELPGLAEDYTLFTKSLTWGFQAGIGLDILKKITLDARYEGSLSRLGETMAIGGSEFELDARPSQWVISLGIMF